MVLCNKMWKSASVEFFIHSEKKIRKMIFAFLYQDEWNKNVSIGSLSYVYLIDNIMFQFVAYIFYVKLPTKSYLCML